MAFGVLPAQDVGKAVTMCMKFLFTILARCGLKNALPTIHMLEGMLVVLQANDSMKVSLSIHCVHPLLFSSRLSSDGRRTLFVDLDSDALKPEGWCNLADEKPVLNSFCDISIYELHIRDFR